MTHVAKTSATDPHEASARAADFRMSAVAHDLSGRPVADAPSQYLLEAMHTGRHAGPCGMVTVSQRGTLFFSPAVPNAGMGTDVLRSHDGGRNFSVVETPRGHRSAPKGYKLRIVNLLPQYFERLSRKLPAGTTLHPFLHQDAATGRIFVSTMMKGAHADGSGSVLAYSDDDGGSWASYPVGEGSWDWGKVFTGPPASEASRAALAKNGYPNVVYFTATGPTLIVGFNQLTYKSLDGGKTFTRTTDSFSRLQARTFRAGYPQTGVVSSQGAIFRTWAGTPLNFVPVIPKNNVNVNVMRSLDEGQSWQHFRIPNTPTSLLEPTIAIDAEDTLYLAWADRKTGAIRLSQSRDRAETWSTPLELRPPGTVRVAKVAISVRGLGDIALAYWGSARLMATGDGWVLPDGRPYHGYLSVCRNLNAEAPVFFSARVCESDAPLLPKGESALRSGEYVGAPAFAPDGSVWAGFVSLARPRNDVVARLVAC